MCRYRESYANIKGELGGDDYSKSNGDQPTLACHSVDPVGIFENSTEGVGGKSSEHCSYLRVRTICAINVEMTKVRIGANDVLLHL